MIVTPRNCVVIAIGSDENGQSGDGLNDVGSWSGVGVARGGESVHGLTFGMTW